MKTPPALGDFDYGAYLAAQGIHSIMSFPEVDLVEEGRGNPALGYIYDMRRTVSRGIDEALPEPQASLAQALLLGLRGRLPQEVTEDFRSTGTSHLLAISGLHVGTLLALSLGAAAWAMGRRRQLYLLLPLGAIWAYALLSGLSASVERAAIMGTIYHLALFLGRPKSILPALALAAGVMLGIEPHAIKDVSFQLSFTAVAGIALLSTSETPLWSHFTGFSSTGGGWWRMLARVVVVAMAVSVAATIATLPLIAFNFHRVPTVGVVATVLALPALPFILMTSGLAAIAGLIHPLAGQVVGWVAWIPLEYVIRLVNLFSRIPGSIFSVPGFSGLLVWAYYGAFATIVLMPPGGAAAVWRNFRRLVVSWRDVHAPEWLTTVKLRLPVGAYLVATLVLAVLAAVLWYRVATDSDGKLHVHFMDVGQGDSTLIVTPEGRQVLIDGGPQGMGITRALGDRMPFGDRDLDIVVLTHPDEDHFGGLTEVLNRYHVDEVLEGSAVFQNPLYLGWQKALNEEEVRRVAVFDGMTTELGGGVRLEVLNPSLQPLRGTGSDLNNNSVVLRLVYGEVSFLLAADIEAEAEERLIREGLDIQSSVLKVAHHGSRTSTTPRFLSAVNPVAAVISAGADNPYGHPHSEVTSRLEVMFGEDRTYPTAERGRIEFVTDGARLWVRTDR